KTKRAACVHALRVAMVGVGPTLRQLVIVLVESSGNITASEPASHWTRTDEKAQQRGTLITAAKATNRLSFVRLFSRVVVGSSFTCHLGSPSALRAST